MLIADAEEAKQIYRENKNKAVFQDVHLAYLSWQDMLLGLDLVVTMSPYEEKMVEDLKLLLKEKGFLSFEGFTFEQPEVKRDICWTIG